MITGSIAPGIKGIRRFMEDAPIKRNWHIFVDGKYESFNEADAAQIIEGRWMIYRQRLVEFQGNGLYFENV